MHLMQAIAKRLTETNLLHSDNESQKHENMQV